MFKNLFQKSSKNPPFSDVELILKQINPVDLNDLGKDALSQAFTGFYDEQEETQAAEAWREFAQNSDLFHSFRDSKVTHTSQMIQDGEGKSYRRYAGDSGLPRGRYYSVCIDETGRDNGTLVQEIRAYHNPLKVGMVLILDSTEPEFREEAFNLVGTYEPHLLIKFVPTWGQNSQFSKQHMLNGQSGVFIVHVPMRVTREIRKNVLDLRQPDAAEWFTYELTRLSSNKDSDVKIVDPRPPLDSFIELLPSLLEQGLGGSDYLNVAGTWLRSLGAQGLIFPSARTDASVTMKGEKAISASGFNFVDFSNAPPPRLKRDESKATVPIILQGLHYWPQHPQYTPAFHILMNEKLLEEERMPRIIKSAQILYAPQEPDKGSWWVTGLRNVTDANFRYGQALMVLEFLKTNGKVSAESVEYILGWLHFLYTQVDIDGLGSWSYSVVMSILFDDRSAKEGISTAIKEMEANQINPELVKAVREFIEIVPPKYD